MSKLHPEKLVCVFVLFTDLGPIVDTDGAEAMKMKSRLIGCLVVCKISKDCCIILNIMIILPGTEVLLVSTTGHTMQQAHVATLRPAPLHPPDPCPKVKRASPDPTARRRTSTQPPAPTNSPVDDPRHAPTLDPCPGHALAPGRGLDASPEATD